VSVKSDCEETLGRRFLFSINLEHSSLSAKQTRRNRRRLSDEGDSNGGMLVVLPLN